MNFQPPDPPECTCALPEGGYDHDMKYESDTIGDYGVINGTMQVGEWVCQICGYTEQGDPPQYDDD